MLDGTSPSLLILKEALACTGMFLQGSFLSTARKGRKFTYRWLLSSLSLMRRWEVPSRLVCSTMSGFSSSTTHSASTAPTMRPTLKRLGSSGPRSKPPKSSWDFWWPLMQPAADIFLPRHETFVLWYVKYAQLPILKVSLSSP
ncbi:hypothetical protein SAY86_017464 [Trapa natans]|uniref:Uncharacterized protein n=1 Tax=Trapa natans TaxID=22666 RepID=A0AAN7R6G9_TRANT|nr:hypothetical protein SAY86_017464 [Trapa natans]